MALPMSVAPSLLQAGTHARVLLGTPKTSRLASHMHIKPGELENILLARELEELLEPRAVDWPQALGLTTLDPGVFFPCPPVISFHQMLSWHCVFCHFILGFCEELEKRTISLHCVLGKEQQYLSLSPVWLPFLLPPLFLQLLPYLCEEGVTVTAKRRYWSLQISNSCSWGWFLAKTVLKNPAVWKYTCLCKCSPLPIFFHSGFICA